MSTRRDFLQAAPALLTAAGSSAQTPSANDHIRIATIGFGLYCQLLRRTIALMKGEKVCDIIDVKLNLDFIDPSPASENEAAAAALPYSYIEEDVQRMSYLKRFAEAADRRVVKALVEELKDRFGPLPPAARRFARLAELRVACAKAGIGIVDAKGFRAILYRNGTREIAKVVDLRGKTPDRKIGELASALARPAGEAHKPL